MYNLLIHSQNRMQRQAACGTSFGHRPKSLFAPLGSAQHQVTCILNGQNFTAHSKCRGSFACRGEYRFWRHRRMPQKPRKAHLKRRLAATQPANATPRFIDQCPMQQDPPFLSRSSPNVPNPYDNLQATDETMASSRLKSKPENHHKLKTARKDMCI